MKTFIVDYQQGWEQGEIKIQAKNWPEARKKVLEKVGENVIIRDVREE